MDDVNSWMRGTPEFHENWTTMKSNDSTVCWKYLKIYELSVKFLAHFGVFWPRKPYLFITQEKSDWLTMISSSQNISTLILPIASDSKYELLTGASLLRVLKSSRFLTSVFLTGSYQNSRHFSALKKPLDGKFSEKWNYIYRKQGNIYPHFIFICFALVVSKKFKTVQSQLF